MFFAQMVRIAAVLLSLAFPATAHAAALALDRPCYRSSLDPVTEKRQQEAVNVAGAGFTPGAFVDLTVDGTFQVTAQADAAGNILGTVASPFTERPRDFTVTATDRAGVTASIVGHATLFGVDVTPRTRRSTRDRITLRARGFLGNSNVLWAHYVREHKLVKTVRLGTLRAPCGTLTRRIRQLPIDRPRAGSWVIQIDLAKKYRARREPYARLTLTVTTAT